MSRRRCGNLAEVAKVESWDTRNCRHRLQIAAADRRGWSDADRHAHGYAAAFRRRRVVFAGIGWWHLAIAGLHHLHVMVRDGGLGFTSAREDWRKQHRNRHQDGKEPSDAHDGIICAHQSARSTATGDRGSGFFSGPASCKFHAARRSRGNLVDGCEQFLRARVGPSRHNAPHCAYPGAGSIRSGLARLQATQHYGQRLLQRARRERCRATNRRQH